MKTLEKITLEAMIKQNEVVSAKKNNPFDENFKGELNILNAKKLLLGTEAITIINDAASRSAKQTSFLSGVLLGYNDLKSLVRLIGEMDREIRFMANYEHCFHSDAESSEKGFHAFFATMLKGAANASLSDNE